MQQPVYIRPRVTPRLLLMVTIVSVGLIGLSLGYRASLPSNNPAMGQMMVWLSLPLIAAIYGMAFSLTWIASAIDLLVWRRLAQLAIAAGAVILLERLGNKNFAHYAITLGGILIFQEIWFWCLAIPNWRGFADAGENEAASKGGVKHQFGIGSVIVLTTCAAILFAVARVYQPIGAMPFQYWLANASIWTLTPLVLAKVAAAISLDARPKRRWRELALTVGLASLLCLLLLISEIFAIRWRGPATAIPSGSLLTGVGLTIAVAYGLILLIEISLFAVVAAAGRKEGQLFAQRIRRQTVSE